ncbi:hypothetical protein DXA95_12195 [Odoribacter sp. OF09-27XD]|nr:hypothetical protein DXA95_12195 [Odoribacter sp. OF09-27XD]RHV92559.1 hypothetical protein DXA95_12195 [Odoribacter sp. OF09-27XD]DAV89701.1 MAG TPA: hypothetical protein [Bacteriophage sp.]
MIVKDLYIKKYDWNLRIYYAVTCYYTDEIMQGLFEIHCPERTMRKAYKNMSACRLNTGLTYSNPRLRETIMVIGMWSHPSEFDNSLSHELRHFTDHVANTYRLESGGEEVAYLTGDIRKKLFPINSMFLCNCKDHKGDIQKELYRCNCKI